MNLRTKIVALAVAPLLVALVLVALAVRHQERDLARREKALIEQTYMNQRRNELRSYVDLAVSIVKPLYDAGPDDDATRAEALRRLGALDYGSDGYFFVYDMQGLSLMHSRQPELVGQTLWDLRDSQGRATIQDLVGRAREGGGFVEYQWRKPSSAQLAPKLGYVTALPRWNWMLGTGLYLDDIDAAMQALDRQTGNNVTTTMLWIAGIAALCLGVVSATGLLLNLSEHRVAEARLRLLARQVVQSQEDERAHLARELHDGTSQTLVSAKLLVESGVDALERAREPVPPVLGKALQRIRIAGGGAPHLAQPAAGAARHAGPARRAGTPGRRVQRRGRRDRLVRAGRPALRASAGSQDRALPHRPGGAHQCAQACAGAAGVHRARLRRRPREPGDR